MSPTVRVGETSTLVSNLVDQLTQRLAADDAPERLVVGLAGAPGSGKSTIAEQLKTGLKAAGVFAGLVAMDGFHLSNAVLDELEDGAAFEGVSKYPNRVKCALLGWMALKDALAKSGVALPTVEPNGTE